MSAGQGSVTGKEDSLLARVTRAAEERQLSPNTILAYRRTWLKLIAWATSEVSPSKPCQKTEQGSSRRGRLAVGAPLATVRLKRPLRSSTRCWCSLGALLPNFRLRKSNCAITLLRKSVSCYVRCVRIAAATLDTYIPSCHRSRSLSLILRAFSRIQARRRFARAATAVLNRDKNRSSKLRA